MTDALLNVLFGCTHRKTTFPLTSGQTLGFSTARTTLHRTYVVCLDCGKEFDYDWKEMRMGRAVLAHREVAVSAHAKCQGA
jgi:hypothetical protein